MPPAWHITDHSIARIAAHLQILYPALQAEETLGQLIALLERFQRDHPHLSQTKVTGSRMNETDVVLITYADQIQEHGKAPLESLSEFLEQYVGSSLTAVHILPFYPYTSDDGFSVVNYLQVDPALGDWSNIEHLHAHFRLMFDAVVNHVSASSAWFQSFCAWKPEYADFFIVVPPSANLSGVRRPRALPLITVVETDNGPKNVWTTYSADQIDLNYANPAVLLAMTEVLLTYVALGAHIIRLDAVAYLWKEIGTPCIHLPQTHRIVQFWRSVLDVIAPQTLLISQTNVPHTENISYFGDGTNEAQLIYQFPLAILALHAFHTGDASYLQQWASELRLPSNQVTFFNFLASHDGIGLRPAEGILSALQRQELADLVLSHGGYISYATNPDGSQSPYELNISYFDALNDPMSAEPVRRQVDRFMASQAILLSMAGVPGIYIHSLFGSRNWREGVSQSGRSRTINREKFNRATLEAELAENDSLRYQVFTRYKHLLSIRCGEQAFHPNGAQQILTSNPALFSFVRTAPNGDSQVLCIHNVSGIPQLFVDDLSGTGIGPGSLLQNLLDGQSHSVGADGRLILDVPAYGVVWLRHGRADRSVVAR